MNTLRNILTLSLIFCLQNSFSQEKKASVKQPNWGVSFSVGANTTSTKSTYASFADFNWSVGVVKNLKQTEKLTQALHLKFSVFKERFKNLNYYYLENEQLVNTKYTQKNSYPMLYLGYEVQYNINQNYFIHGGAGFNYMLPARYKRLINGQKQVQQYGRPANFFVTRPELSLGVGIKKQIGNHLLLIKPTYSYNFTIQQLNLVPSFNSLAVETVFYF